MAQQPTFFGRLQALIQGEVAAATLEAYRGAGRAVYDLLQEVEDRRLELRVQGTDPWSVEPATQALFLCAWNAFFLQTLGDQLLDADYRENPATVGYVPAVTAEQILALYGQVESWLNRAHQARSNPAYRLDVDVPAALPPWSAVEPCPRTHLEAMLAATESLQTHAEAALAVFEEEGAPAERQSAIQRLRQLLAEANAKAAYGGQLWARAVPRSLHEQIEAHAKDALARYYTLGQLLAMPQLVDRLSTPRAQVAAGGTRSRSRRPLPGQPGFDPWCLTDPATRADWQRDPEAREAMEALWAHDPEPGRTLALQDEIDAALARGDLDYATDGRGRRLGCFYCCPWPPIYMVRRPLTLAGRPLQALQQFTLDVSAEDVYRGGPFRRELLVGVFNATEEVDYCNPAAGGHPD